MHDGRSLFCGQDNLSDKAGSCDVVASFYTCFSSKIKVLKLRFFKNDFGKVFVRESFEQPMICFENLSCFVLKNYLFL